MPDFINQTIYPFEFGLHQKYAQSQLLLELIWTHTNLVAETVTQIMTHEFDKTGIDPAVATQAALLSDIGVYNCEGFEWMPDQPLCSKPYIQHSLVGAWILKQEGLPNEVIQVAQTHSGVGILPTDIQKFALDLPLADYSPKTNTQQLIAYASKFHSKSPKFKTVDEILATLEKYGPDKKQIFIDWTEKFGIPDLTPLIKKHTPWHNAFSLKIKELQQKSTTNSIPNLNSAGIT